LCQALYLETTVLGAASTRYISAGHASLACQAVALAKAGHAGVSAKPDQPSASRSQLLHLSIFNSLAATLRSGIDHGKTILVRFSISGITPDRAQSEQAFSEHGGKSC